MAIAELESAMSDKDDIIVDLEAQLAETEQFLEQVIILSDQRYKSGLHQR